MEDNAKILAEALVWARSGKAVALATVLSTWGSSPRAAGSRLAVDDCGHFIGSVSGGCVEGEVLAVAEDVMATGKPAMLDFGVSDQKAWSVGLACGGAIKIMVEKLADLDFFAALVGDVAQGHTAISVVTLATGARTRLEATPEDAATAQALNAARDGGRDVLVETPGGSFLLEFWRPPLRLFIVGAVHIAQALAPIAAIAGYDVALVDPRTAFATPERFAGVPLQTDWPERVFSTLRLDERCAVVALTHEPAIDDPALIAALRSSAFYIGALGSRATAEKRRNRLRAMDFSERDLARVHGPVGLAIGAANPAEIAIAIAAEMTAALRGGQAAAPRRAQTNAADAIGSAAE